MMNPKKLKDFAQSLSRRRDAIRKMLLADRELCHARERVVGDDVDAAVDREHEEMNSNLAAVEIRELRQIEDALARIRAGNYGTCGSCGKRIPAARLAALRYATLCIKCQREEERMHHEHSSLITDQRTDELIHNNSAKPEFT